MNTISRQILDTLKVIILASAVVLSMQYVFAWTGAPASGPPNDNVDPPVNVSNNSQVKLGEFGVNKLTAGYVESIATGFTNTFAGPISAAAGTFSGALSGASLSAGSGAISGGSLNVGTGAVMGGQGTFTGGVTVGTSNGTFEYLQLDNKSSFGGFESADCDARSEGGRMYYDSSIGLLYLCVQERANTTENGWKPVSVEYESTQ